MATNRREFAMKIRRMLMLTIFGGFLAVGLLKIDFWWPIATDIGESIAFAATNPDPNES